MHIINCNEGINLSNSKVIHTFFDFPMKLSGWKLCGPIDADHGDEFAGFNYSMLS